MDFQMESPENYGYTVTLMKWEMTMGHTEELVSHCLAILQMWPSRTRDISISSAQMTPTELHSSPIQSLPDFIPATQIS